MDTIKAHSVTFQAHGMSDQGHGLLVFEDQNGRQVSLAIKPNQLPMLLMAVADILSKVQNKLIEQGLPAPALPLDSWTITQDGEDSLLILRVFGSEMRFRVTPTTVKTSQDS